MTDPKARRGQLISTYGIGGLFPSETTSFMIAGLHEWNEERAERVSEPRLARALGVADLKLPPAGTRRDVPVIRFPYTQVCPSCRRIGGLSELSKDWNVAKCSQDKTDLSPFRLITVCRRGHIDEFPYYRWLHKGQDALGQEHEMKLKALGRTSSLGDLVLTCSCGVGDRSLEGAVGAGALTDLMTCRGSRPWLGLDAKEECAEVPRVVQRGASNVWFPSVRSAISIPPYSEALAKFVDRHWVVLRDPEAVNTVLLRNIAESSNGRFSIDEINAELRRRRTEEHGSEELLETDLRAGEYRALMEGRNEAGLEADFVCIPRDVPPRFEGLITAVRKVTRLREVRALEGFTRLDGATAGVDGSRQLCPLAPTRLNWLPAIEVIGEGLFLSFDRGALDRWASRAFAAGRQRLLQSTVNRYAAKYGRQSWTVDVVGVAVHTLAHVLIDQLSLDAGYPAASLRERLFVDNQMAGLLVYTASSDSAGSMGGVASMAEVDRLEAALQEGLQRLSWCSSDPVCIESLGAGADALNLAACHACVLLPETSCEMNNSYLDRALLFGTPEGGHEADGLFSEFAAETVDS